MKSPYPGMDPYLERSWGDVHSRLITAASGALNGILPEDLVARVEERVVVDCVEYARPRAIYPDARVIEGTSTVSPVSSAVTALTVAEPILLELEVEEHVETYIAILDPSGGRLITVIEFLSPSNKLPGENRDSYRQKRNGLQRGGVNLVEIDLIRTGAWRARQTRTQRWIFRLFSIKSIVTAGMTAAATTKAANRLWRTAMRCGVGRRTIAGGRAEKIARSGGANRITNLPG